MQDFRNVKVVLVNTSHPGNIGASARAMKNMGLENLTLVEPEKFPSGVAVGRAASAVDILESAIVVISLESAVAECGMVIAASARSRRIPWPMLTPEQCARKIISEKDTNRVALVFGREDSGLNNDELQLCNYHVQIPTNEISFFFKCRPNHRIKIFSAIAMASLWGLAEVVLAQMPLFWIGIETALLPGDRALAGLARWVGA